MVTYIKLFSLFLLEMILYKQHTQSPMLTVRRQCYIGYSMDENWHSPIELIAHKTHFN